jgi:broad specificity phosphatase PhoE
MILLRHGQSEFNLHYGATRRDPGIEDPRLTELGHEQARLAAEAMAAHDIRRIIASPYTRALQTAAPIARRLGLAVTVDPIVAERYAFACDVGSPRGHLERDWPEHDFSLIADIWWPREEEPESGIIARAAAFRQRQAQRDDWAHTLVVSHWGFILGMTGQKVANAEWLRCDPTQPAPSALSWQHG